MDYFRNLPTISYDIKGTSPSYYTRAVNIMVSKKIRDAVRSDIATLHTYRIEDGDRPDIIATMYYGSASYTWLIFLMNNITDPYFDWPLSSYDFENYLTSKYGSVAASQSEVHEYQQIIRSATTNSTMVDDEEAINPEVVYIVDSTTYASLGSGSKKILYKYDWELDINEQKRTISLIDSNFADQVISEMRKGF